MFLLQFYPVKSIYRGKKMCHNIYTNKRKGQGKNGRQSNHNSNRNNKNKSQSFSKGAEFDDWQKQHLYNKNGSGRIYAKPVHPV